MSDTRKIYEDLKSLTLISNEVKEPLSSFFNQRYPMAITPVVTGLVVGNMTHLLESGFSNRLYPWMKKYDPMPMGKPFGFDNKLMMTKSFRIHGCFLAPVAEELLFRGMMQPAITEILKCNGVNDTAAQATSVLTTSALFAIGHNQGLRLSAFHGGLFYGAVTSVTGDLWPATVAHMINNNLVMSSVVKQLKHIK